MKKQLEYIKQFTFLLWAFCMSINNSSALPITVTPHPQQMNESGQFLIRPSTFRLIGSENLAPNVLRELLHCVSDCTGQEGFPLRVGIRGDESVRKYRKQIPGHAEGYYLCIDNHGIVVAGNDRRGLYYGIRTLEQLLAKKDSLSGVEITDWPDVAVRGVVEGFYGQPWSYEARMGLIDFYSAHKLNTYIYGPKNDRYHSTPRWRQPYPEKEAEQLRRLVAYAHEKEVDFVWAIHPGRDIKWDKEDRDLLVDKLESMYALGVRAFAVFFDDISGKGTDASKQVELLNDLNRNFVKAKGDVKPLIMCPTQYNRSRWKPETGYLKTLGEELDEDIHIMWTGDRALSDIKADNLAWVQTQILRQPYIWWNFPVTDFANDRILMGEVCGIDASIRTEVSAFVSNPMEYAEASKLALYSVADYTWNITAYDAGKSWKEGIRCLLPDASEAFACFCRHSSATGEAHFSRPESECIRVAAERFRQQYHQDGNWLEEDMKTLKEEFEQMEQAADELTVSESNLPLTHEIAPWIKVFGLWARMGQEVLALVEAVDKNDAGMFVRKLEHLHVLKRRVDKNEKEATLGTAVVQPFIKDVSGACVERFNRQNQTNYQLKF